ncbi:MAG: hypothetical protein KC910_35765, partial [Candidatus Eremiobacteraeota bacterium]|nr:hypothetical protein [Candidatus Eremiobacteraeota bacterium]
MRSRVVDILILVAVVAVVAAAFYRSDNKSPEVQAALEKLVSDQSWACGQAAAELPEYGSLAVPGLLALMADDKKLGPARGGYEFVSKAEWQSVRAGMVLEALAFVDFGFAQGDREQAIARARAWWAEVGPGWRRVDGLEAALASNEPRRIEAALKCLRQTYGSPCEGLTRDVYFARLAPHILRLRTQGGWGEWVQNLPPNPDAHPANLTLHGHKPGSTRAELDRVRRRLGPPCGPAHTLWPNELLHVRQASVGYIGHESVLAGDALELDGRPVATAGDPLELVVKSLGAPTASSSSQCEFAADPY